MKVAILIAGSAMAACACASNKHDAKDPTQVPVAQQPAPSTPTDDGYRPSEYGSTSTPERTNVDRTYSTLPPSTDAVPPPAPAEDSTAPSAPPTMGTAQPQSQPDNSRVNKREQGSNAPTPMDQGNGAADLKITQQIRQAVVADGSLSFTAKNVKIITTNGKVTLRGPVNSEQERNAIEASARRVAGDMNVDNQLEVKK